jgi:hypothetical protein
MTDLDDFTSALAEQIRADARGVVVPPVDRLRSRARRRAAARVAGAALAVLVVAGAGTLVAGGLPGGSQQGLIADAPAETVLDSGVGEDGPWQLVGRREGRCILLVGPRIEGGSCDLADPPQLHEMMVRSIEDRGAALTLVAGIAPDGTADVRVAAAEGDAVPARVLQVGGDTYYVVRLPGTTGVRSVVALDDGGRVLDRFDGMPAPPPPDVAPPDSDPPPPPQAERIKAPPPDRIAETDEFGVLVAVRETPQGLEVDVNRVDMLGGQEAEEAAAARGMDVSNDYFLVDDNPMLRTYRISPDVEVWGDISFGREPGLVRITVEDLRAHVEDPPWTGVLFHLDVEKGLVVGIEEQYRP